ncbi:Integrin alpha ina-1 [Holothuria leucospilota]|uniref:Integrin alpha ina-1 n=1 Tax=Holothuria leucospilota TaxID=206669 RepID=A0A9Q0YR51_HOLLE|nr:Integrin alpha ina-1 [Holothuria leucospilota]
MMRMALFTFSMAGERRSTQVRVRDHVTKCHPYKSLQVLRPSDFSSIVMKRFGFALSGNKDADKNSFPDLLIGAYESDTVILVRTRPIIRPEISVSFSEDGVHLSRLNSSTSFNG